MTKEKDKEQALENLKALEEAKFISRRDFLSLSSLVASTTLFTNFLTMESSFAWVATRMRRGKSSNSSYFDVGDITNSLRFRSANLTKTPASAGSLTTWTFSTWVKRGKLGTIQTLFGALSGAGATTEVGIYSSDVLYFVWNSSNMISTTAVLRDPSSWYHIVFVWDTTQATATDRIRFYVNGVQQAAVVTGGSYPGLNQSSYWSGTYSHYIGSWGASAYTDGYLSRIAFVGGQALTPSSFGQLNTNSNSWITKSQSAVKAVVDAGGTNSFMLDFDNGSSTTTLGYDKSSNGNNWTCNNISLTAGTTYDWMTDSPSNNYCILTPLRQPSVNGTLSLANLRVAGSAGTINSHAFGSIPVKSKTWFEFKIATIGTVGGVGLSTAFTTAYTPYNTPTGLYYLMTGNKRINGTNSAYGATFTTNDVIGVAVDPTAETVEFFKQTGGAGAFVSQGVITATGLFSSSDMFPHGGFDDAGSPVVYFNFGQQPFSNSSIPTGFNALCTKYLPTPTIVNAKKHFDIILHSGNNSIQSLSGLSFTPNLAWIKARNSAQNNLVADSVRGVQKYLISNTQSAETTDATTLVSFDSSGITVGISNMTGSNAINYVSWLWKGGGAAVSNTQGSITSQVSTNPTAGFSIVNYTGTGVNATVGHGLGFVPKMIIVKSKSYASSDWDVYHVSSGATKRLFLNRTDVNQTVPVWQDTTPTSNVFYINGAYGNVNLNTHSYIAYCFAEISGYSKIGSYTGNGVADGPFVYCGFKPKWVMIKRIDSATNWRILDTARDTTNPGLFEVYPNLSNAEQTFTAIDYLSNGFKIRNTDTSYNTNAGTYIFVAFAETPFKYSNAR